MASSFRLAGLRHAIVEMARDYMIVCGSEDEPDLDAVTEASAGLCRAVARLEQYEQSLNLPAPGVVGRRPA